MSSMRSPRGSAVAARDRSSSPRPGPDAEHSGATISVVPQRVVFVGASGSGKSALRDAVYNRHAGERPSLATSATAAATAPMPLSRIADSTRDGGSHHSARPGRCTGTRFPLRAAVEKSALDDRPSSRQLGARSRGGGDDETASIAASQHRTTLVMVEMAEASVGADCLLPLQLLELRDHDIDRMLHDRLLAHDALSPSTTAVVITVDATALFPPVPHVGRPDVDMLIKTLAVQNLAAVGSSSAGSTHSGEGSDHSPSTANFHHANSATHRTPVKAAGAGGRSAAGGGAGAAASAAGSSSGVTSNAMGAMVHDDPRKAIVLLPDQVLLDAYKHLPSGGTIGGTGPGGSSSSGGGRGAPSNGGGGGRGDWDYSNAEYRAAVMLCRRTIECVRRHHPCPPSVSVVLALTKIDLLKAHFEAMQVASDEATRLGEALLRRKRDAEAAANAADATIVVVPKRPGAGPTLRTKPLSMLRQEEAAEAMRLALQGLTQRLAVDVVEGLSHHGTGGGQALNNTSLFSPPEYSTDSRGGPLSSLRSHSSPTATHTHYEAIAPPPMTIALVSAAGEHADSAQHLMNTITAPLSVVEDKLRRLLDSVRRSCKMHCAALVDLNSMQFIACDTTSAPHMPHAHLAQRKAFVTRTRTRDDVNAVASSSEAHLAHPFPMPQCTLEGRLFGTPTTTPAAVPSSAAPPATPSVQPKEPQQQQRKATFSLPPDGAGDDGGGGGGSRQGRGGSINATTASRRGQLNPALWRDALRLLVLSSQSVTVPSAAAAAPASAAPATTGSASAARQAAIPAVSRAVPSASAAATGGITAQQQQPPPPRSRGEYFKGSIVTDDDLVLFATGLTADHLALVGIASAREFSLESLFTVNVDHLGRAINALISTTDAGAAALGGGENGGNASATASAGQGGDAAVAATRGGPRATVVTPRRD